MQSTHMAFIEGFLWVDTWLRAQERMRRLLAADNILGEVKYKELKDS